MSDSIHKIMDQWLNTHGVEKKQEQYSGGSSIHEKRTKIKRMPYQRKLDLHGLTVNQAQTELDSFIRRCRLENIKKILIIHGKGMHSENKPILKTFVTAYLQINKHIGETGIPGRSDGGSGAVWALIR